MAGGLVPTHTHGRSSSVGRHTRILPLMIGYLEIVSTLPLAVDAVYIVTDRERRSMGHRCRTHRGTAEVRIVNRHRGRVGNPAAGPLRGSIDGSPGCGLRQARRGENHPGNDDIASARRRSRCATA